MNHRRLPLHGSTYRKNSNNFCALASICLKQAPTGAMASAKESYRAELRASSRQLGERCLYSAAKWYAPTSKSPPQTLNPEP